MEWGKRQADSRVSGEVATALCPKAVISRPRLAKPLTRGPDPTPWPPVVPEHRPKAHLATSILPLYVWQSVTGAISGTAAVAIAPEQGWGRGEGVALG